MKTGTIFILLITAMVIGCSTTASFKLPPDTAMLIQGERISYASKDETGRPQYSRSPFFWDSFNGIEYKLVQGDKTIKQGKLESQFRIISIFWPPYAFIYWPLGFRLNCYDLSDVNKDFIEECAVQMPNQRAPDK